MQASDKIPFIQCAYGYTREFVDTATAPKGGPVVLVGFPDETPEKKQYMLRNYVLKAFYLNLIMLRF